MWGLHDTETQLLFDGHDQVTPVLYIYTLTDLMCTSSMAWDREIPAKVIHAGWAYLLAIMF